MEEKRFDLLLPNAIVNDTVKRKSYYLDKKEDVEKLVDLLNSLYDKNEQLSSLLKDDEEEIERLKESNRGLFESIVEHESED